LESRYKYGVMGAGAVSASLIGRLPSKTREVGPVSAVSYRVASRIANTLRCGYPVRSADELGEAPRLLFYAPPDHGETLLELLERAEIDWKGKALVFCDCFASLEARRRFEKKGASTAVARHFGIPGRLVVEGDDGAGLHAARRIARELQMKAVEISPDSADLFDAAVTLGSAAITPLIDRAAALLRHAGIRDTEAARIASSLFEQTARDYAHSGKQSWAWHVRKPLVERLQAQIASAGPELEPVLRQLLVLGFETFHKHGEVGAELEPGRAKPTGDKIAGATNGG
jgi:predicted short-subunit dehydrogenase-like oxidoreductase (DUF2520 family)